MSKKDDQSSISSRSSRRKKDLKTELDASLQKEAKAAYVLVVRDIKHDITSKKQLAAALHQAGRDPSQQALSQYWTETTKSLTFEDFNKILQQLKPTSSDELLKAFRKIDVNGDGFITHNELAKVLTQRGEKMTDEEVRAMIKEADADGDNKLNYKEFCNMLMSTTEKCKEKSVKRLDKRERRLKKEKKKEGSVTSLRREEKDAKKDHEYKKLLPVSELKPSISEPENLKSWSHVSSKGCFYFDESGKIVSHQYRLQLSSKTKIWLTARPLSLQQSATPSNKPAIDTCLYLLKQNEDTSKGDLITFTKSKLQQKWCICHELDAGIYRIIPMTSGCRLKPRKEKHGQKTPLVEKVQDEYKVTKEFRNALIDIFDMVDLDSNGTLSRDEFNMFQLRTSGEVIDDDAWEVVEENFELKKGELTRKGFMDLNEMEANDVEGDTDDLWVTLRCMGFSDDLSLDESCPFIVDVFTENGTGRLRPLPLQYGGVSLEQAICSSVLAADSSEQRKKLVGNLELITLIGDCRTTTVIQNKGSVKSQIKVNCRNSENCASSRPLMEYTLTVPASQTMVAHHMMPRDESKEWHPVFEEEIIS
ncbi:EF-hand calcium-binding domain-containing protein 7 [Holothuria leucospilota]|uniref:EF-hand calcium-binding domain-containing protein 7 n=1 Tax=Holothuria leucospilota TaxID=206669 RepID=A0A9Q1C900_HOLLE|nr:EF-hand calcium-binding domain-containing protein 7 [Holothuria leucospilota]